MKKVFQTKYGDDGNCMAACIASVLELPLVDIPRDSELATVNEWRDYLEPFGLSLESVHYSVRPRGYSICSLWKSRDDSHAVVAFNGEVVHDPGGAESLQWAKTAPVRFWYVFTLLDPRKPKQAA